MTELDLFPLPFRAAHVACVAPVRTVRELEMMRLSASIRAKPEWFRKREDAEVVARWSREAAEQGMTQAQIRYVLDELGYYAELRDAERGIEVSAVDGVWQSDSVVDEDLRKRLAEAVRVLEEVPAAELDWHPGSDGQVLDLVHPSMYCLVRGVSLPEDAPWPTPEKNAESASHSKKFQWLPTDVEVGADGSVAFLSYVNNVDPDRHQDLAAVLPELFGRTLPLLENVLTDLRAPKRVRIVADPFGWYEDTEPQPPEDDDEAAEEAYEEAMEKWWEERQPAIPDAPEFQPPERDDTHTVTLSGRRLQVIVKLANIHLTPDKPEYPGGSWHVEAMLNERIVATAIYYWDSDNITESLLGFRTAIDEPYYEQNDRTGVREVYGLDDEDALNQELGSVRTTTGRCVAFPNIYQHRVAPFRLDDPTRNGHRKIVAFFLVDPSVTITSTADIPPQQPWSPTSTMTRAQAEEFREQLMHERKFFVDEHNEEYFEREFYLCEH
ncbi:DUF4246 domain-containing protein [Nocardia coubleae]|uniref:DUF4246 domain-containing protein n=1 Tax=Nocardia coubleae TaxID=356147 RepID=A0A846W4G7_9NOCA|nr:DUF4246 domain-containing protein [Nocardia coubleae]NKX88149.1 DUF4246 domain-containing protein [Nocardia coubleae]